MKFLIDENVGQSVIHYLTKRNHDVILATGKELNSREDYFLLKYAYQQNRIVVTNDKDFGYLIYHHRLPTRGIILFRFVNESPSHKIFALETLFSQMHTKILNHFVVISEGLIRVRPIHIK